MSLLSFAVRRLRRSAPAAALLAAGLAASGCATITKGSSDTVTVDTRPPGAVCEIRQGETTVGMINPTPGSVSVPKSKHDLAVSCSKAGYLDAAAVAGSEFQGMTVGNVLFGGLIGVAVDAASGAMNEYPALIELALQPEEFESEKQRDLFFDRLREDVAESYATASAEIEKRCANPSAHGGPDCEAERATAARARDEALERIETRRVDAAVREAA